MGKQKTMQISAESFTKLPDEEKMDLARKIIKDPQSYALLDYASKIVSWNGWDMKSKQYDPVHVKIQRLADDGLFCEMSKREISISPKGRELLKFIDSVKILRYEVAGNLLNITFGLYDRMSR